MIEDLPVLAANVRTGQTTVAEVLKASLVAMANEQPILNPWIRVYRDVAVTTARALDTARTSGRTSGPLHGVPVALKDNLDEAGVPCTGGCAAYLDRVPARDAPVVARLRAAGAVVVGRTNMHELAGGVTSENPHFGPVRNPWDPTRIPGGSSGGSAVVVATGSVAGALGTDTGGSIRIPASLCGIVGLKPTRGLLPQSGVLPFSPSLDHVGPLARSVAGVRILLGVLAGRYVPATPQRLTGLRIGILEGFGREADPAVGASFDAAITVLEGLGARLKSVHVPGFERGIRLLKAISEPEAAALHGIRFQERPEGFGPEIRHLLDRGRAADPSLHPVALSERASVEAGARDAFIDLDFMICPTTPFPARPFGSPDPHLLLTYTCPFNLTGQPAISVPMGLANGLPVGLQIVAPHEADARLLDVAEAFEQASGGFRPPPFRPPVADPNAAPRGPALGRSQRSLP
ncbi:MAG: amidase [Deltaproteobacteria bacterium]|nr:amidase [Deltaproteobacteria bacterium]